MKRIVHCVILVAVLIGLPLVAAWLDGRDGVLSGIAAFPPRTEDWGGPDYWQRQCPFS